MQGIEPRRSFGRLTAANPVAQCRTGSRCCAPPLSDGAETRIDDLLRMRVSNALSNNVLSNEKTWQRRPFQRSNVNTLLAYRA